MRKISGTKLDIGDANRLNRRLSAFRILGSGQTANTSNGGRELDNVDAKDNKTIYFVFYMNFSDVIFERLALVEV